MAHNPQVCTSDSLMNIAAALTINAMMESSMVDSIEALPLAFDAGLVLDRTAWYPAFLENTKTIFQSRSILQASDARSIGE